MSRGATDRADRRARCGAARGARLGAGSGGDRARLAGDGRDERGGVRRGQPLRGRPLRRLRLHQPRAARRERVRADLRARHGSRHDDAREPGPGRRRRQQHLAQPGRHARLPLCRVRLAGDQHARDGPAAEARLPARPPDRGERADQPGRRPHRRRSGRRRVLAADHGRRRRDRLRDARQEPLRRRRGRQRAHRHLRPHGECGRDRARVARPHGRRHQRRPSGRRVLSVDVRRRALRRVRHRGGGRHGRGRELRRRRGRARPRGGHDDAREPGDGREWRAGRLPLLAPAALGRRFEDRVRVPGRQPRLDLAPGRGDALASPQRLRPRHGGGDNGAGQPRERAERGAGQRPLGRAAGPRDL